MFCMLFMQSMAGACGSVLIVYAMPGISRESRSTVDSADGWTRGRHRIRTHAAPHRLSLAFNKKHAAPGGPG